MARNKSRTCAVCGSQSKRALFHQHFDGVGIVTGYTVVVCEDCGFAFADEIPSQESFDQYYRELSKYEYKQRGGRESESDEARQVQIAEFLEHSIPARDARILEIGCATGRLPWLLRRAGFADVRGLDPSPACAEAAWRLYGIPVDTGSLYDLARVQDKYDFVILVAVLEHLCDLREALIAMRTGMSESGRIYIDVPDCTGFASHLDAPYQQFSTEHINFFSPVSLQNLMRGCGFHPIVSEQCLREHTEVSMMPSIQAIFEKSDTGGTPQRDTVSEPSLQEYIRLSEALDRRMRTDLSRTTNGGSPIIVWGVGTLTQRLLATGGLDSAKIAAFVDSNPKYSGRQLHGRPILAPEALTGRQEPILICSRVFQREIERQIREQLNLPNELLLLPQEDA